MRYPKVSIFRFCFVLVVIILTIIFLRNISGVLHPGLFESQQESVNLSTIPSCVPHHTLLTDLLHKKKGKWWPDTEQMKLLLLSAYDYNTHVVVTTQSEGWFGKQVFCRYLSSNFTEVGPATAGMTFAEFTVNCCPENRDFAYISVTEKVDDPIIQHVPVLKRNQDTFRYKFSMCLSPIYGNYSTFLMFAELIEHYKLQGVEHFYVYIHHIDEYSMRVLHDYIRSGEVEAIYMDWREDREDWSWVFAERIDCLFRTRYHSKYVLTADLDERILPLSATTTLREFTIKEFEAKPSIGVLSFRPRWILRDRYPPERYEGMKTIESDLATLVFHNTSHWPPPGHTAKCIIDPLKLVNMGIHFPDAFFPGFELKYVPPEDVIIRHYRDNVISTWNTLYFPETLTFGNYSLTNYPEDLQKVLIKNVVQRLDRVYSENITK